LQYDADNDQYDCNDPRGLTIDTGNELSRATTRTHVLVRCGRPARFYFGRRAAGP
jgi:hypothetical protein